MPLYAARAHRQQAALRRRRPAIARWLTVLVGIAAAVAGCGSGSSVTTTPVGVAATQPVRPATRAADMSRTKPRVLVGMSRPGVSSFQPSAIDAYSALVGQPPAIVSYYVRTSLGFSRTFMDAIVARGALPMVSASTCAHDDTTCSDAAIASGQQDGYLHAFARAAAAWGRPFLYRLDWEMNGDWEAYAPGRNGNTAEQFVAMWRHVVTLFRQDGATNAQFVWCPNVFTGPNSTLNLAALFPGDAYVDWVGMDGYNWGNARSYGRWLAFSAVFEPTYTALLQLSSRPVLIGEVSSVESGGNKSAWIRDAAATLATAMPRVGAVIWFDYPLSSDGSPSQLNIDSSPAALAAYQAMAAEFAGG